MKSDIFDVIIIFFAFSFFPLIYKLKAKLLLLFFGFYYFV